MGPKMPWWPHAPLRPKAPPAWVAARIRAEEARLAQERDIAAALQEADRLEQQRSEERSRQEVAVGGVQLYVEQPDGTIAI